MEPITAVKHFDYESVASLPKGYGKKQVVNKESLSTNEAR